MERKGETYTASAPDRIYYIQGKGWYFRVSEGRHGPYRYRYQAEMYLETLRQTPSASERPRAAPE